MFGDFDDKLFNIDTKTGEENETKTFELESYADYINSKNKKETKQTKKPKENDKDLLKILVYETNKSKIKLRPLQEQKIIPSHPFRTILCGKSGSGKSMNLVNLLTRPHMYGPLTRNKKSSYFDLIFLFSPTANCDDLVSHLDLDENKIITEEDLFVPTLQHILKTQKSIIENKSLLESPKILIIFDDIQSAEKFIKSKDFTKVFIMGRHYNISTFVCCQSWTRLPRVCRLQASNIMLYPSANSELVLLTDEYTPPNKTKNKFMDLVKHATKEPYSFLHINNQCCNEDKFRKNLDKILNI